MAIGKTVLLVPRQIRSKGRSLLTIADKVSGAKERTYASSAARWSVGRNARRSYMTLHHPPQVRLNELARVEDAVRVESALHGAMQRLHFL
jgi:hypothetical protein